MPSRDHIKNAVREEFKKHHWDMFAGEASPETSDTKPGYIIGCPNCRAPLNTERQFLEHLTRKALEAISKAEQSDRTTAPNDQCSSYQSRKP